jgi:hypothetical protein
MEQPQGERTRVRFGGGANVYGVPSELPATLRARWLAELSEALDDARQLLPRLPLSDQRTLVEELFLRIEAVRLEVQSLRLSRSLNPREQSEPEWTFSAPWDRSSDGLR